MICTKNATYDRVTTDFLPERETGDIGVLGVDFIEDRYLPEMVCAGARSDSRLYAEAKVRAFRDLQSYEHILDARKPEKSVLITMEGLSRCTDRELLEFYGLGVPALGLTCPAQCRRVGGLFAPTARRARIDRVRPRRGPPMRSARGDC